MAADDKGLRRQALSLQGLGLEAHGLPLVLLGLLAHIAVPEGVIVVPDLDDGGVQVEGQGVFNIVVDHIPVRGLIGDVGPSRRAAHDLVVFHLVHRRGEAVEDHKLAAFELVEDEISHVGVVGEEGGRVGEHELLVDHPGVRHGGIERIQKPHAVILDHDALAPGLLCETGEVFLRQLALIPDHADLHALVGKLVGGVLLLPLLAQKQKGPLAVAEALVLQGLLDEAGLPRLQKAGEEIDGHIPPGGISQG